jgi:hypothetical protein
MQAWYRRCALAFLNTSERIKFTACVEEAREDRSVAGRLLQKKSLDNSLKPVYKEHIE